MVILAPSKLSSINLTKKEGIAPNKQSLFSKAAPVYMMPVVIFMNKEYNNIDILKSSTLQSLGISGNASLRMLYQFTDRSLDAYLPDIEKMIEIPIIVAPMIEIPIIVAPITATTKPPLSMPSVPPVKLSTPVVQKEAAEKDEKETDVIIFFPTLDARY